MGSKFDYKSEIEDMQQDGKDVHEPPQFFTKKDLVSDIEPRWCPGCGSYAVLNVIMNLLPKLGLPREKFVFVSGIGCSSRFPYYINTYGFHTIHGRAPAVATGLKLARPDLSVWVITGDGDALSIGGNHFIHIMRRNPNIKILLFNNQIYGLTKGQASPTTIYGKKTKSTPWGAVDVPIRPISMALAAGATFVARVADRDINLMKEVMLAAANHRGTALIEIYQNCVIFNDGAFRPFTDKDTKDDATITLRHGEPLIFGKNRDRGIRVNKLRPEVVRIGEDGITESDILVHDVRNPDPTMAYMLSLMQYPLEPVPFGIFRQISRPTYEDYYMSLEERAKAMKGEGDIFQLFRNANTWEVGEDGSGGGT